eukprot:6191985-Pleurochrysis_carterae.AAC.2
MPDNNAVVFTRMLPSMPASSAVARCHAGWVHQLDGLFTTPLETAALVVGGEQDRVAKRGPGECAALFKRCARAHAPAPYTRVASPSRLGRS